ncbi:hypothetical protein [Sphingomonas sp.]|uniref:hypothetical protein n=1 Tax=Sphingomonas sp. TaxID=28214 RepID=UPI003B3BE8F3
MVVAWLLAQAAAAAMPAPAPASLQAQFEQASAALVAKQYDAALAGFRAIEARPGLGLRTRGVVTLREGIALYRLGRPEAAETLRKGLALVPSNDKNLTDDRVDALLALGGIERGDFDFVAARREFEAARALSSDPVVQLTSLMSLADVTMFDDDDAALNYIDEALRLAAGREVDAALDGNLRDIKGRVLLNRGDFAGALTELNIALKDRGGITTKTSLDDVAVRSDLTLAYLLAKRKDKARDIIGMTGQGRLPDNAMLRGPVDADLPTCGGDLKPDDVAVVEFGIGEDGTVLYASPIYASRRGPVALEFARSVYGWSWDSKALKEVPPFYRLSARLELRCTTAADRPSPIALLESDLDHWLEARHVVPVANADSPRDLAALRVQLRDQEKTGPNDIRLIPILVAMAKSSGTDYQETRELLARADKIAAAEQAPPAVRTYLGAQSAAPMSGKRKDVEASNAALARMIATTAPQDARSSAAVRLTLAQSQRIRNAAGAAANLDAIIADTRLDRHDPLRVGALLQLAAIKAQQSDLVGAQQLYQQTGLNDQQCALVDASPVRVRGQASEQDYPAEARAWGISGWARTEFDVKADGTTEHIRTVMAYPAFVFGPPMEGVAKRLKYTQSYRPQGGLGCGGATYQPGFHYVTP